LSREQMFFFVVKIKTNIKKPTLTR